MRPNHKIIYVSMGEAVKEWGDRNAIQKQFGYPEITFGQYCDIFQLPYLHYDGDILEYRIREADDEM